jgi:hypothetical protein
MQSPINAVLAIARSHIEANQTGPLAAYRARTPELPLNPSDDTPTGVQLLKLFETHLAKKPNGFAEPAAVNVLPSTPAEESVNASFTTFLRAADAHIKEAEANGESLPTSSTTPWLAEVLNFAFPLDNYGVLRAYLRATTATMSSQAKLKQGPLAEVPADLSTRIVLNAKAPAGTVTLAVDAYDTVNKRQELRTFSVNVPQWGQTLSVIQAVAAMNDIATQLDQAVLSVAQQAIDGTLFTTPVVDPDRVNASHIAAQAIGRLSPADQALLKRFPEAMTIAIIAA